jgi:hypothetical protein
MFRKKNNWGDKNQLRFNSFVLMLNDEFLILNALSVNIKHSKLKIQHLKGT